ncbi:MAG: cellulase family glycosylhydrolase [Phycisphaeraceae bacterium]|nr:cellulase family glycosylhydrolase [Phycisphaeraceae bacterium]
MSSPGFIQVASDGHTFCDRSTGRPFVPIGCNYFDPDTGWSPKIWSRYDSARVARQLAQIAAAGFTTIRVFLDQKTLNPLPEEFSAEGFAKVADMIRLAGQAGLRIVFSGPNGWEGGAKHLWGDSYADEKVLDLRCRLWTKIIERFGGESAVMAWDLMNEPHVHWPSTEHLAHAHMQPRLQRWRRHAQAVVGSDPGPSFPSVEPTGLDRALYRAYVQFLQHLTDHWVDRQCQAIRAAGAKQLITIGIHQSSIPVFLPPRYAYSGFDPRRVARHLDYTSIHFYPLLTDVGLGMVEPHLTVRKGYLEIICRAAHVPGKPLVMEEFAWKGGRLVPGEDKTWPEDHQTLWCDALVAISSKVASGWLNWAYADSPDPHTDISAASGLWTADRAALKHWGRRFVEIAAQFKAQPPAYQPASRRYELDLVDYLFDNGGRPDESWLQKHCGQPCPEGIELLFT